MYYLVGSLSDSHLFHGIGTNAPWGTHRTCGTWPWRFLNGKERVSGASCAYFLTHMSFSGTCGTYGTNIRSGFCGTCEIKEMNGMHPMQPSDICLVYFFRYYNRL